MSSVPFDTFELRDELQGTLDALSQNETLGLLPEVELRRLAAVTEIQHFERAATLYCPGDDARQAYAIVNGRVRLSYNTADGDEVVIGLLVAGQETGATTVLSEDPVHFLCATAIEPTACLVVPRDALLAAANQQPILWRRLLTVLRRRIHRDAQVAFLDLRGRVASRLLELDDAKQGTQVRISQQDLAGFAAASRPNVNRALSHLSREGAIRLSRGGISIRDRERLLRFAREVPKV